MVDTAEISSAAPPDPPPAHPSPAAEGEINFHFPVPESWGKRKHLRCCLVDEIKVSDDGDLRTNLAAVENSLQPCTKEETARPWNLRSRKAGGGDTAAAAAAAAAAAVVAERVKFSVQLTSEEIAEDIYAVTGKLPRRRPKKRARVVQRQLDALFPGSWLTEITADIYKALSEEAKEVDVGRIYPNHYKFPLDSLLPR